MAFLDSKYVMNYILVISIISVVGYLGTRVKNAYSNHNEEHELIRKYLLNDSPLYGYNRPKLWVHTKYEYNARKWQSFSSRSSHDLNQPYLHLTVKTIINQCGNDFNVCLIDDESFSRLIPGWDVNISHLAEPTKTHFRELAMMELLYIYGGMVIPNSFVCLKNLLPLYQEATGGDRPFVCETVNRNVNSMEKKKHLFMPDPHFIGAPKRSPVMKALMDHLKIQCANPHFSEEVDFVGSTSSWCKNAVNMNQMNLVDGILIGAKTRKGKPILLEELMEEKLLDIPDEQVYGILIPADEVLRRHKYQWLAVTPAEDLLGKNMILSHYLMEAVINGSTTSEIKEGQLEETRTVISI